MILRKRYLSDPWKGKSPMKPVYLCSKSGRKFTWKPDGHWCEKSDIKIPPCSGTLQPYFSASDIENLIKGRRQELIMKTMYDGSMGIMVDPDLSVYNELNLILAALEGGEE